VIIARRPQKLRAAALDPGAECAVLAHRGTGSATADHDPVLEGWQSPVYRACFETSAAFGSRGFKSLTLRVPGVMTRTAPGNLRRCARTGSGSWRVRIVRSSAPAWKAVRGSTHGGSNPSLSAGRF
jgi:hypothetical protein